MGSRGKYAGQPHLFACSSCRKSPTFRKFDGTLTGIGLKVTLTGRTREQSCGGANYHHWPKTSREYKCDTCGHVGWSRHPTLQWLATGEVTT